MPKKRQSAAERVLGRAQTRRVRVQAATRAAGTAKGPETKVVPDVPPPRTKRVRTRAAATSNPVMRPLLRIARMLRNIP